MQSKLAILSTNGVGNWIEILIYEEAAAAEQRKIGCNVPATARALLHEAVLIFYLSNCFDNNSFGKPATPI